MNEVQTKFVSLIVKLQNKTCCWFHSFTLLLPVLRYNRTTLWHELLFGIYGNIGTCHVMLTMSSISIISII